MRDLTPEELKLAPDWATHYDADYFGSHRIQVCFFDNARAVDLLRVGAIGGPTIMRRVYYLLTGKYQKENLST